MNKYDLEALISALPDDIKETFEQSGLAVEHGDLCARGLYLLIQAHAQGDEARNHFIEALKSRDAGLHEDVAFELLAESVGAPVDEVGGYYTETWRTGGWKADLKAFGGELPAGVLVRELSAISDGTLRMASIGLAQLDKIKHINKNQLKTLIAALPDDIKGTFEQSGLTVEHGDLCARGLYLLIQAHAQGDETRNHFIEVLKSRDAGLHEDVAFELLAESVGTPVDEVGGYYTETWRTGGWKADLKAFGGELPAEAFIRSNIASLKNAGQEISRISKINSVRKVAISAGVGMVLIISGVALWPMISAMSNDKSLNVADGNKPVTAQTEPVTAQTEPVTAQTEQTEPASVSDAPIAAADPLDKLYTTALADIKANRLSSPKGSCAMDKYASMQKISPGDPRTNEVRALIAERYLALARSKLDKKDYTRADRYAKKSISINPTDEGRALSARIAKSREQNQSGRATVKVDISSKLKSLFQSSDTDSDDSINLSEDEF